MEIKPTNPIDEKKGEFYTLEDKDFLLISALRNLAIQIEKLSFNLKQ